MTFPMSTFSTLVDVLQHRADAQADNCAYTFLEDGEQRESSWTYADLDRRARAIAAAIQDRVGARDPAAGSAPARALLLYLPGLEYIGAFFGCLYAGALAVPAYPPQPGQTVDRLLAIIDDAAPAVALTTSGILQAVQPYLAQHPRLQRIHWIATDTLTAGSEDAWQRPARLDGDTLAFLQYTSGSTATPRGVMVSHRNLMVNNDMIRQAFGHDESTVVVGWLPLYHDMGLIGNVLHPLYMGVRTVLMSPWSFLQRPARWLWAITRYRATTSGGPNFGYALCVRKVKPEQREHIDLRSWRVAFNGAEPVRGDTLERFIESFAPEGFRRETFYPCYGLAEATLFVSGAESTAPYRTVTADAAALERDRLVPIAGDRPGARPLVSCGRAWADGRIIIADPDTGAPRAPGEVGEIWLAGAHVARGYWQADAEANEGVFRAPPASPPAASLAGPQASPDHATYLRTGDLGVIHEGELYVTGRIKDMIIIEGRNHYAQDIERTVEDAVPGLRPGCVAAFSIEPADNAGGNAARAQGSEERLVVVAEVDRRYRPLNAPGGEDIPRMDPKQAFRKARQAISTHHGITVHDLYLTQANQIPKTSSGKLQRRACRARYLAGDLPRW